MFRVKMRAAVAFLLNLNIALYFTTGQAVYQQNTLPTGTRLAGPYTYGRNAIFRARRDSSVTEHHVVDSAQDCMLITSDEGHFFYKSVTDESTVCGIFMITDPTKRVEMVFTFLDVPCESSGLVAWIDGWELNGQYFPAPGDHPRPMDDRFEEFCGARRIKQMFVSSQNVALLQYRVPAKGKGFSITVRHVRNPAPCNVLLYDVEDIYTLRNYGKASNCSLSTVFPASVRVMALSVGVASARTSREVETGTIHKCQKRGLPDYVEIGGSAGFDNINLEKVDTVCGLDSTPARSVASIFCEVTTVRLVSGGQFENSVTIGVKKLGMDDIMDATLVCGM